MKVSWNDFRIQMKVISAKIAVMKKGKWKLKADRRPPMRGPRTYPIHWKRAI